MGSKMLNAWWEDFISIFYPNNCWACSRIIYQPQEGICLDCSASLPFTNFENHQENPMVKIFWGRVKCKYATALFYFNNKTRVQTIMHLLKYKNKPQVGEFFGKLLGERIVKSLHFDSIDYVIPVPLHPSKKKKRGYNQAEAIAKGIATESGMELSVDVLIRNKNTSTQTKKTREERVQNMHQVFDVVDHEKFVNRKVLLVDDVITTGSTLESCILELQKVNGITVYVATLAYAE